MGNDYPIEIKQGEDFEKLVEWLNEQGDPINLTSATAKMQVRQTWDSNVVLVELSTTNGRITITPLMGQILLTIPNAITSALDPMDAVYDLEITDSNHKVKRILQGEVKISPEVTR